MAIGPAPLARGEKRQVGGHRPAVLGLAKTVGISMTSAGRDGGREAARVPHRFKVKAFSSIWNARDSEASRRTPPERLQKAARPLGAAGASFALAVDGSSRP